MIRYLILSSSDDYLRRLSPLCPPERYEKAMRMRREEEKVTQIIAGGLLTLILKKVYGIPREAQKIETTPKGKPFLFDRSVYFNLSHSKNRLLLAFSEEDVGCDIQTERMPSDRLQASVVTDEERHYMANDPLRFAQIWTVKEAYCKYTGEGISKDLRSVNSCDRFGIRSSINGIPILSGTDLDYGYTIIGRGMQNGVEIIPKEIIDRS